MATSGSSDFNLDMAEITEEAFERCGLELRTGYDAKTARRSLNLVFADCDLEEKVTASVNECMFNTGQSCDAPTRLLVEKK